MSNKSIQTNKLRLIWELPLSGAHHTAVQSYSSQRWAVTCTFVVLWLGRLIWSNSKHRLHFWQSAHVLWRTLDNPLTDLCHNLQFALLEILSYLVLFLIGSLSDIFELDASGGGGIICDAVWENKMVQGLWELSSCNLCTFNLHTKLSGICAVAIFYLWSIVLAQLFPSMNSCFRIMNIIRSGKEKKVLPSTKSPPLW